MSNRRWPALRTDSGGRRLRTRIAAAEGEGQHARTLVEAEEFELEQEGRPVEAVPVYRPRLPRIAGFEPGNREQLLLQLPPVGRTVPPELMLFALPGMPVSAYG